MQSDFKLDVTTFGAPHIFPAVNFDPITTADSTWFIFGSGDTTFYYNQLKWVNGFTSPPEWQGPWGAVTADIPSYYNLISGSITAPQLGSSIRVNLTWQASLLQMAIVRKIGATQYLWTCRQIGVNSAGNNDDGQADRSAVEWFKIQTTPSLSIVDTNRIYDNAATNPRFYYIPSLVVNKNGDIVVGFSGSSVNDYISSFYSGKLNSGSSPSTPIRYLAGKDWFNSSPDIRWGDYSCTSLDPNGLTIWTIQEYAETRPSGQGVWGTWVVAVTPF